jgi:hypothetical protein
VEEQGDHVVVVLDIGEDLGVLELIEKPFK